MGLNLTPMIDVVFLLLVFFIVGNTMIRPEGFFVSRIPVPAQQTPAMPLPITPIRVVLTPAAGGSVRLAVDPGNAHPAGFDDLARILRDMASQAAGWGSDTPVIIAADQRIAWDHVVNAFNAARRAGFEIIRFGVTTP